MQDAIANSEVEVRFGVPAAALAALAAEMGRGSAARQRRTLAAVYFDTADRRLAREGISWRVRREGRRWIQAVKAAGASPLERFEHESIRPDATPDPDVLAATPIGRRLSAILARADADGTPVVVRFRTRIRRDTRRIRTRGAVVEVASDDGWLLAGTRSLRVREVEFELVSGSLEAMLAMAERWRKRFGLVYEPRSKAERGDRLAEGSADPPVRKARAPAYPRNADAAQAFAAVFDECFAHVVHNAIGLLEGARAQRVDHVHQMRVGIRRLRTALRSFAGWVQAPPPALVEELRALFGELGRTRDSDVLDSGVVARLATVGAPTLAESPPPPEVDPAASVRADRVQQMFLAWLAWRANAALRPCEPDDRTAAPASDTGIANGERTGLPAAGAPGDGTSVAGAPGAGTPADPRGESEIRGPGGSLPRSAERRLRKWHRRIVADLPDFDALQVEALHALRKRIKRQRYAVEFFAPVLRRRTVDRYLRPLAAIQQRMGELNDLFVARARYEAIVATDPAAWFALGWLAARVAEVRTLARRDLKRLAREAPPTRRSTRT